MEIRLEGGDRVSARWSGTTVTTDQDGSSPAPFELFLASLGTCAGFYVARFCHRRGIPATGVHIEQHVALDAATHVVSRIDIDIHLPDDFPSQYRDAVLRAAGQCVVKKHLEHPPEVAIAVKSKRHPLLRCQVKT